MLIIVVYDNVGEQERAIQLQNEIRESQVDAVVGVASEEDVRQEDIVGYLYWQARQEEADNEKRNSD